MDLWFRESMEIVLRFERIGIQDVHIEIRIREMNLLGSIGVVAQGWDFETDVLRVIERSGR
jgi:hypothetical protein